jgi:hypothetical protein
MRSGRSLVALLSTALLLGACSAAEPTDAQESGPSSALTESTTPRELFGSSVVAGVRQECAACHAYRAPQLIDLRSDEGTYQRLRITALETYVPRSLATKLGIDIDPSGRPPMPDCARRDLGPEPPHRRPSPELACAMRAWVLAEKAAVPAPDATAE